MVDESMVEQEHSAEEPQESNSDHPHAGVAEEGWSAPDAASCHLAKLIVKRSGAETELEFHVNPPCIIGRFDAAVGPIDIDLGSMPEGNYVSRKHAKIECDDGTWKITDLGSSNGTFLLRDDFEKVDTAELKDGDEIALGNARFVFHTVDSPAPT
jgi:pSer/pThr/pTyr-binding forkhead associated (FHA) protein